MGNRHYGNSPALIMYHQSQKYKITQGIKCTTWMIILFDIICIYDHLQWASPGEAKEKQKSITSGIYSRIVSMHPIILAGDVKLFRYTLW
jgi:hypothetical protein